jgi:hypothetical protein
LLWYILEIEATVSACDPSFHVVALVTSDSLRKKAQGQKSIFQQCFKRNRSEWTCSEWNRVQTIVSHPSRENFPGNEDTHGGPREIPVGAQCTDEIECHMLSDVSHPSRENFPGDENSKGVPREIPVGEQCSEFKSSEAEERGAY